MKLKQRFSRKRVSPSRFLTPTESQNPKVAWCAGGCGDKPSWPSEKAPGLAVIWTAGHSGCSLRLAHSAGLLGLLSKCTKQEIDSIQPNKNGNFQNSSDVFVTSQANKPDPWLFLQNLWTQCQHVIVWLACSGCNLNMPAVQFSFCWALSPSDKFGNEFVEVHKMKWHPGGVSAPDLLLALFSADDVWQMKC